MKTPVIFSRLLLLSARSALALVLGLPLLTALPGRLSAAGRWTPNYWDWRLPPTQTGRNPVHLNLLPGDGAPYHSRILWWSREFPDKFEGGQWGWCPSTDDGCLSLPQTQISVCDPARGNDHREFRSGKFVCAMREHDESVL